MTATPQRESEGIGRGELKDAKWELQRCGILLEGKRERERDAKELVEGRAATVTEPKRSVKL